LLNSSSAQKYVLLIFLHALSLKKLILQSFLELMIATNYKMDSLD